MTQRYGYVALLAVLWLGVGCDDGGASGAVDASPPDVGVSDDCEPGDVDHQPCGDEGTRTRFCGADGWGDFGQCEAPCAADSEQARPCGINGAGQETRTCEAGRWGAWSVCQDDDTCETGRSETNNCDEGGTQTRRCVAGQWSDFAACVDTEACLLEARALRWCGLNNNGLRLIECEEGVWRTRPCDDPDRCLNGTQATRACGVDGWGQQTQSCQQGQWSRWTPCQDPDALCELGDSETLACGVNHSGQQSRRCEGGIWSPLSPCRDDADVCVEGAIENTPCEGPELTVQQRRCEGGQWSAFGECGGAGHCDPGEMREVQCGLNGRGRGTLVCENGRWAQSVIDCEDEDVCRHRHTRSAVCPEGPETATETCTNGQWSMPDPPCYVPGDTCPVPRVWANEVTVQPFDIIRLDASDSTDAESPDGRPVQYRWTVLEAPDGSKTMPVESFLDGEHPENGAIQDNPNTHSAQLLVDLVGEYTLELSVADATGQTAPSARCPEPAARVRISARPEMDVHVQLTWEATANLDLHVRHPNANAWSEAPLDCHAGNPTPDWGPPGEAGNPRLTVYSGEGGPQILRLDAAEDTEALGHPYRLGLGRWGGGSADATPARLKVWLRGELAVDLVHRLDVGDLCEVAQISWTEADRHIVQVEDGCLP